MILLPGAPNCGLRLECREYFFSPPRTSDPDMHHGTCVTHVPWCIPGSLTSDLLWSRGRGNVPGIPSACATCSFAYLVRGQWSMYKWLCYFESPSQTAMLIIALGIFYYMWRANQIRFLDVVNSCVHDDKSAVYFELEINHHHHRIDDAEPLLYLTQGIPHNEDDYSHT